MLATSGPDVSLATEHVVTPSSRDLRTMSSTKFSGPVNKPKTNQGATMLFNENDSLAVDLTNKLKICLEDRKHLRNHGIDLFHAFLNSYLRSDIKSKKMTRAKKRLFRKFVVVL